MSNISAGKLGLAGLGILFAWSAFKGGSVTGALRDLISGKQPATGVNPITGTPGGGTTVAGGPLPASNSAIAQEAEAIGPGHAYRYGGAPGRDGTAPWDCSSFCNFVIGARLGMPIPGYGAGKYTGATHGPPTGAWILWPGAAIISRKNVQAGDLCIWPTHMGIALSSSQMISAHSPAMGTSAGPIQGPTGEIGMYKRMKYAGSGVGQR